MRVNVHIGLCGWTISMREYFERFPVVEVQQTFYHPPADRTLVRWRESAPDGFEFTLKAWQLITHETTSSTYRRSPLTSEERAGCGSFRASEIVQRAWQKTADCARLLRATSVLFQCPASFRPTDENIERMRAFFTDTDRHGLRFLWEPRGPAWTAGLVQPLCESLDLVHVVDPLVNRSTTPGFIYFRLHGIGSHHHVYTDAELSTVIAMLQPGVPSYVMFNNMPRDRDSVRFERALKLAAG